MQYKGALHLNETELRVDYNIPENHNAGTFGPIEQNATVDIPEGSSWVIVGGETNTEHAGFLRDLADTDIPGTPGEDTYLWYDKYTNTWKPKKVTGRDGNAGSDGEDGESAYEIAVNNGFTGSEQDWLDSLHGEDGDAFTYDDFTQEQLDDLTGPAGPQGALSSPSSGAVLPGGRRWSARDRRGRRPLGDGRR